MSLKSLETALADIHKRGFALDNEEYHVGIRSIAAPVRDERLRVIAAVSIAGPTARLEVDALKKMAGILGETAESIGLSLRGL